MKNHTISQQKNTSFAGTILYWSIPVLFGLLTLAACVKSLIYGMDIDESYAVSCAYRLVQGDRLLADMWEPHQLASVYLAPILALYLKITGSTTGIVLYARMVGLFLHILVGILALLPFRKMIRKDLWTLLLLIHINFLPKWVQLPEFELLQYWFLLLMSVSFYRYLTTRSRKFLWLAGLLLVCQLMCYPSLILLYPVLAILIIRAGKKAASGTGNPVRDLGAFTLGAAIPGVSFLLYLLSYQSVSELLSHLGRLAADPSHSESILVGLSWQTGQLLLMLLVTLGLAGIAFRMRRSHPKALLPATLICIAVLAFIHLCILAFSDENQFAFLWRYAVIIAVCGVSLLTPSEERSPEMIPMWESFAVPGICAGFCVQLITNMSVNVTMAKLFSACFGVLLMLGVQLTASPSGKRFFQHYLPRWVFALFALSLFFPRALMNRVTGCVRSIVWSDTVRITDGPAKGIRMRSDLGTAMNQDQITLSRYLTEEDSLLAMTNESLLYLMSEAAISGASTQGTSAFDQLFLDYLEEHPDKYPTAVAVDTMLDYYPYYYNPEENDILRNWIREEFPYTEVVEADYLTLYLIR